ncbi:MAG: hypothetical protein OEW60_02950 [Thiovulaceae bacterium]|nr:hypothetical protein [Sulfurimonadaceae bacterium]
MTKKQQLNSNRIKPKLESTFGKRTEGSFGNKPSKGTFGKKPSKGNFGKRSADSDLGSTPSNGDFGKKPSNGSFGKKPSIIKAKPKAKKSELPFLQWLHDETQLHRYTCLVCDTPVQDWHHVKLYSSDKKDHKRLIPLCKVHHTGGSPSPHVTPVLWRETYSLEYQHKIADAIYAEFKRQTLTVS